MRIILINAPISARFSGIECTYDELPPATALPLLSCKTERRLQDHGIEPEILVFDRPQITTEFIRDIANSNLVGFTTWFSNTDTSIEIAMKVKTENPELCIVFGGPDASNLGPRLLVNRTYIDYVVSGDGEDTLWRIAAGHPAENVPNLWYRNDGPGIRYSYDSESCIDDIEPFDFRHVVNLDLSSYDSRRRDYSYDPARIPVSVVWTRGCPRANTKCRCAYCSIPSASVRSASPKRAWAQVEHLHRVHGISAFFEGGDDFASFDFAESLLQSPYRVKNINLRSYAGLWGLSERKTSMIAELGLSEVFIGLETVDKTVNAWSGHKVTRRLVFETLQRLRDYHITVCIPFIFGLPGESHESLCSSEALAYDLVERFDNIRMVLVSLGIPLIGSRWFQQLSADEEIRATYGVGDLLKTDAPDYARLLELSVGRFCSVPMREIVDCVLRIRDRLSASVKVGWFGDLDRNLQNRTSSLSTHMHTRVKNWRPSVFKSLF